MDVLRLTLRQLQVFVSVAQSGGTTQASAQIALSQSAVSAAVNTLERVLSVRLFDRTGKRLLLNENGRALLPRALALLDGAARVEHMARGGSAQAHALRIGASTTLGTYVLPRLLARFLGRRAPDEAAAWQSRIAIGNTAAIGRGVAEFELDVGLVEGSCSEASLTVTPWLQDEMILVASPGHALARHPPRAGQPPRVPVQALREAVWLLREPGSGTREATDQALLPRLRSYRRSIELGSSEAIKHAAAQGLGIACLSRWVAQDLIDAGRLACLATGLPKIVRQCHVVVHRDKRMTPALSDFVDCVSAMADGLAATAIAEATATAGGADLHAAGPPGPGAQSRRRR